MSRRDSLLDRASGSAFSTKLTFDPQEFHSEDFSVDEFIQRKRQAVPLDVLRDDLGSHLKFLRSSLIELINEEYGQFVNLSSNLVGLDGRIQSIVGPLVRARNDLEEFDKLLDEEMNLVGGELEKRRGIRAAQVQLQLHKMALAALESSEKYMCKVPVEIITSADFNLLRVTCEEMAETRFLLQKCATSLLLEKMQSKWDTLCSTILQKLNGLLKIYSNVDNSLPSLTSIQNTLDNAESVSMIKSLLYMYTELQCEAAVEEVFVTDILKPKCEAVMSRKGNVNAIFEAVEQFLKQSPLITVWTKLDTYPWMARYDFITRGVFPHVINLLEKHFPHIWAPSNPDSFHTNWSRCERFITTLEDCMPSTNHLEAFRNCDPLNDFVGKWQFPVYFQLRFHSLAIELESSLETVTAPCATSDYKLDATRVMVKVLNQCWDKENVYISHISGRFLKASALIASRYIKELEKEVTANKSCPINICISAYSDLNLAELIVRQILVDKMRQELKIVLPDVIENSETSESRNSEPSSTATQFLVEFRWQEARRSIESYLIEVTVSQSSSNISAVTEVPRLYRRTNRDVPSKHLEYVEAIIAPVTSIKHDILNAHQSELWDKIGSGIGDQIMQRYKSQVQEVLISVQRMEESLKRLKKVKGQNQSQNENSKTISDDDKIRLQIQSDVAYFTAKMHEICPKLNVSSISTVFETSNGKS